MRTGPPKVTGSVKTSSAPIHTPTPVETHANSRWRTFSPLTGASDLRGHEAARGQIRGLADRVGQKEQGQRKQMMFPRKLSVLTLYSFDHRALL
jgi:hypothetical protein